MDKGQLAESIIRQAAGQDFKPMLRELEKALKGKVKMRYDHFSHTVKVMKDKVRIVLYGDIQKKFDDENKWGISKEAQHYVRLLNPTVAKIVTKYIDGPTIKVSAGSGAKAGTQAMVIKISKG